MGGKYIITFQNGNTVLNAVAKAPSDMATFLEKAGYHRFDIVTMGGETRCFIFFFIKTVWKLFREIQKNSEVIIQYPIYSKKGSFILSFLRSQLKIFKKVKFVALVHDIRYLRGEKITKEEEISELNKYSSLVVHSSQMDKSLKDDGCNVPTVILGLFDYAVDKVNCMERRFSKQICFAGNLAKSFFLEELPSLCDNGLSFCLYGTHPVQSVEGIEYCGAFEPNDLSSLQGSWGLVWDGYSTKYFLGNSGVYQKYNSPHKASLYVAAEMPLVVNAESAIADVVREKGIGVIVNSLSELDGIFSSMDDSTYLKILENVRQQSLLLRSGENIKNAIRTLNK